MALIGPSIYAGVGAGDCVTSSPQSSAHTRREALVGSGFQLSPFHYALSALAIVTGCSGSLLVVPASGQPQVSIVESVQFFTSKGDFNTAQERLRQYRSISGVTAEYLDALSWIGRAELARHDLDTADKNAGEVRGSCLAELAHRQLDQEPHLPLALGASIEVHAQVLGGQNRRDEAVLFLREELSKWRTTSIRDRIQKNLNLLTLEGKPAPPLDTASGIGPRRPSPLTSHRGHPVLLFLWAHWCPDCKAEVPVLRKLLAAYANRGLEIIAPTRHYGYVAQGEPAAPDVETQYITQVYAKYYEGLGAIEIPLSEMTFARYGVSSTPTIVLLDGKGLVRLYNPGAASYELLASKLEPLFNTFAR